MQWWLCREDLDQEPGGKDRAGHLRAAGCPAQPAVDPAGTAAGGGVRAQMHRLFTPMVPHPRAGLRGNKRPHIEILTAFKEIHKHSSNICSLPLLEEKQRGFISILYIFKRL